MDVDDPDRHVGVHRCIGFNHEGSGNLIVVEQLQRALKDGFTAAEVEEGKKALLEARRLARTQDRALASRLGAYLFAKRTFAWDIDFESKIAALGAADVNAALRRNIDPARLSLVWAGDFRK